MSKESINPEGLSKPVGPYAHVTTSRPGTLVFASGAIALDADGNLVGKGDVAAQTRQVMENLKAALEAVGARFEDVVKITNYVTDASEFPKVASVRQEYLMEPYPASALIEVKALLYPEVLIEIEAIAVIE